MTQANDTRFAPPGRLLNVAGTRLHIHATGAGQPPVIFEAAGMDFSPTWTLVQPEVAAFAQAISYDRAGLGWSDSRPGPRTAAVFVDELRALLAAAGIAGPYVLVGHSSGSLTVRLFAYRYPAEVAGMVLVDGAHEDQFRRFPEPIREMFAPMKAAQLAQMGQLRDLVAAQGPEAAPPLFAIPDAFPLDLAAAYRRRSVFDVSRVETMIAEFEGLEASQDEVRATRPAAPGDMPLVMLSHGVPQAIPGLPDDVNAAYEVVWQQMQRELAARSLRGRHVVVEGSGHNIHHDRPDAVVAAIREVVEAARG